MRKISFLIAAHNEEKIISATLENLISLPYKNYEVIIGLDGCTDRTEEIVKKFMEMSNRINYYKLNLRNGKSAVINEIIKKATGEIIIINDADWIFRVESEDSLNRFLSVFDDPSVGGIAESFPVEWPAQGDPKGNLGFNMVAYSSYFWFEFQKKKYTYIKENKYYVKDSMMFLTNIFRKKLYKKNQTLGDDFERTCDLMKEGYGVVIFKDLEMPRMISSYKKIDIRGLYKQKFRTAIARKQLKDNKKMMPGLTNYYIPAILFLFTNSWKRGLYVGGIVTFWILITVYASLASKGADMTTKEGWTLRVKRL